jgi:hypothetical protein
MYINKIDEIVDKVIDDFYNKIILKNKDITKILSEINFVKYQLDINKLLVEYQQTINDKELYAVLNNEDNVLVIINMIKRYVAYYLFLTIGFHYNGKKETYINNILEFSKNQPSFNYKVTNFFNSQSNSNVIRFFSIIKNITTILQSDKNKIAILSKKDDFKDTITFLNELGQEFVTSNFKLENLKNSAKDQGHNIIKTIILMELYTKEEKKDVYLILESTEKETGEYTFIDIVVPKTDYIDFSAIESVLSKEDVDDGLAYDIYELITSHDDFEKTGDISVDEKILSLINNNILVPIVEDFMLYHKDSEKYERVTNIQVKKKKEDTRLRYIISKIDSVSEYYSNNIKNNPEIKKNIEKSFYLPLNNRKAILINDTEELKIINKLDNQGRATIENNEFYNDLKNYRLYPYINFKDLQKNGITINSTKTVDAVRNIIFEHPTKQNDIVQLRVGSSGQSLNIVGFMVKTNVTPLYCLNTNDLIDVRQMGYNGKKFENGYTGILKFIKHSILTNKKYKPSVYWLFDPSKDKIKLDKYEQIGKLNNQENSKLLVAKLYDDIIDSVYNRMSTKIDRKKNITFYEFQQMFNFYNNKIMELSTDSTQYNNLLNIVSFEKYLKTSSKYDKKEDYFFGLDENVGKIIKLPVFSEKKKKSYHEIWVNVPQQEVDIQKTEIQSVESYGAICQHNITWDNLTALRKKNPNKFNELLVEFIYQYIIQNNEEDFVCKGCGTLINLKKFVVDGSFDTDGRYTTFSTPMQVALEDIPEYEKYKPSIRNIDKIIERLASVANLYFLLEKTVRQKNAIKLRIIKDTIDTIILHNKNLNNIYKERSEKIVAKYGVKELSNLFVFPLDNNIFIYSSKDKDHYKPIKRNNILSYIIFFVILELTDSQILYLGGDKLCNFYTFSKIGYKLFDGINIIKNNKNTITPIQKYKSLCYILFYISCVVTKYNMWYENETDVNNEDKQKTKKFNPIIQKTIIQTMVDLINSIMEVSAKKRDKQYLYNMISTKFFQKLNTSFKNDDTIYKLKQIHERKVHVSQNLTKKYVTVKIKPILLSPQFTFGNYNGINIWSKNKVAKYFIPLKNKLNKKQYNISNLTNCPDGKFHIWITENKTMKCANCKQTLNLIKYNSDITYDIVKNYRYNQIKKYAEKYCTNGNSFHKYVFDDKKQCNICKKCDFIETNSVDKLTKIQLDELDKSLTAQKEDSNKNNNNTNKHDNKEDYDKKVIDHYKSLYGKSKTHKEDFYNYIKEFITNIENTIGKDVNINAENLFVRYDAYIIDHDHNGYLLDKPFIINDKDNKIQYKKDHPFFKKNVIYYTNNQLQIDVFYDAFSMLLLGFKERNRDFQYAKKTDAYMRVNYSVTNRLRLLGYTSKYVSSNEYKESDIKYGIKIDPQDMLKNIISTVSRQRIQNLKKAITDIQRYIYRLKYNYPDDIKINNDGVNLDEFMNKYKKKLQKMKIKDDDGKNKIFEDWKVIKYNMFFQDISDKTINLSLDEYIQVDDLNFYDYHGNIILFYIINELNKLIKYNDSKFLKVSIVYLIIDIITRLYDSFNEEQVLANAEIKRFNYILKSKTFVFDMDNQGHGLDETDNQVEGFYGDYKDPDEQEDIDKLEQLDEDKEEMDALDVDTEIDYEVDY